MSAQLSVAEELLSVGGRGQVEYCRVGDRPQERDVEKAAWALTAAAAMQRISRGSEGKEKERTKSGWRSSRPHLTWHAVVIQFLPYPMIVSCFCNNTGLTSNTLPLLIPLTTHSTSLGDRLICQPRLSCWSESALGFLPTNLLRTNYLSFSAHHAILSQSMGLPDPRPTL